MTLIRRPRLALILLGLAGLLGSLFGSAPAMADTPTANVPVTVTAIVNGHTFTLGQTITGLKDGDVVDVHVDAGSPPNAAPSQILSQEGRECSNVSISNLFDFTPTQGGNCADKVLGSGDLHDVIPVGPPNQVSDMMFKVGEGTTTFDDEDLNSHTITCEDGDTCKLAVLLQVPNATDFVGFPITFGTPIVAGPPGAPTGVSASAGNGQASVSWTAPTNTGNSTITSYTATAAPGGQTCTSATTTCTVTGLNNFTAYTFTVKATNAASFTSPASSASAAVTPMPTPPTITDATAGVASATVTWTAANPAPTNYTVTSSPGGLTCTTSSLSCTVDGLTNGTAYTFTVKATYAGGSVTSAPSASVTPVPPGPHQPGPPTQVTATAGNGQATVNWFAPTDMGNSALTGFEVTSSPGGQTCTSATTTCTVTGLNNFTSYTFTVTASNAAKLTSDPSAPSNAVTPMPTAPVITHATAGDAQATVTWTAADPAPTNYTVMSSPGGLTCTTSSLSCTVDGLTNGTAYTFTVKATYAGGSVTSAPSASVTPVAPPHAPGAPTGVTATAGNGQATVSWTAPADAGNSTITSYAVTSSPGGMTCSSATTSCTVTGLDNFTSYTFTVKATNAASLTSVASGASNAVTPMPSAPVISNVTAGDGQATITWTAADPAPTSYTVMSSPGGLTCMTASLSCTVTGLTDGTAYTFTVEATYAGGSVTSAPSASVTPTAPAPPGPPTNVSVTAGNGQVMVSWTAPDDDGGSPITSYTVTASTVGQAMALSEGRVRPEAVAGTCTTTTTSCTVTGLDNFTAYTFTVAASNGFSLTGNSSVATPAADPVPSSPTVMNETPGDGSVVLTWSASDPAANSYTVTGTPGGSCTTTQTTCTIDGLKDGTSYTFVVTATFDAGTVESAQSDPVTPAATPVTTPATTPATDNTGSTTPSAVEGTEAVSGALPRTGSPDAVWLFELGAGAVALGAALLLFARRRRYASAGRA
jgi:large repetitive protein